MSELQKRGCNPPKMGKRKQLWTESSAKRAKRVAGNDRILRILPDGTMEFIPIGEPVGVERTSDDLDRELEEFKAAHHGQD